MNHVQLPVIITPSRAELGARCHRRHFLGDILGKQRYFSASLEFGSVVHAGAAAHWLGGDVPAALEAEWEKRFVQNPEVSQESVSLALAKSMLEHYVQNAKLAGPFTDQADFKRVDVEQRFELPIKDITMSFQCDRIVYDKEQNWLVVVDTKTAARLDYRWDRQWETSLQMKLYKAGVSSVFQTEGRVDVVIEGLLKHVPSDIRYFACPEWDASLTGEAVFNAYQVAQLDQEIITAGCEHTLLMGPDNKPIVSKPVPNVMKTEELAVRMTPVNYADCYAYNIECPFRRICVAPVNERVSLLRGEYVETTEESY